MTKAELEKQVEKLQEKVEQLEQDVDYWQEQYNEIDCLCDELKEENRYYKCYGINWICDLDNFIYRLKINNLYTEELEKFIQNYIQFYNEGSEE